MQNGWSTDQPRYSDDTNDISREKKQLFAYVDECDLFSFRLMLFFLAN